LSKCGQRKPLCNSPPFDLKGKAAQEKTQAANRRRDKVCRPHSKMENFLAHYLRRIEENKAGDLAEQEMPPELCSGTINGSKDDALVK
jgi:hypothetical protein